MALRNMANAAHCDWQGIASGQPIPENAVLAGDTSTDGKNWIGRVGGQVGKINADSTQKKMNRFRHHDDGSLWGSDRAEILCCTLSATNTLSWVAIKRGEPIPPYAVKAGETKNDGETYVGRSVQWSGRNPFSNGTVQHEAGKINVDAGKMHNLWCHSYYWSAFQEGEILVIKPSETLDSVLDAVQLTVVRQTVLDAAQIRTATASPVQAPGQVPVVAAIVQQQLQPQYQDEQVPNAPESFPELSCLPEAKLSYLQANRSALDDLITDLPQVRIYADRADKLREEHVELARSVTAKESLFTSSQLSYERDKEALEQRQATVKALLVKRDEALQQQSPERLADVLGTRAQNADAAGENCLQKALTASGTMDASGVADFRQNYFRQKTEKHMVLALRERLSISGVPGTT